MSMYTVRRTPFSYFFEMKFEAILVKVVYRHYVCFIVF